MKHWLSLLPIIFSYIIISAQLSEEDIYSIEVSPPSPTVAALDKYVSYPVGLFTGTPNVSLPLWHLQKGELSVPITLNYHASGIRISQTASWVGLGWSITTGGQIARQLRGYPDEGNNGFLSNLSKLDSIDVSADKFADPDTGNSMFSLMKQFAIGDLDSKADIFSYSLPMSGGKFFYGRDGELHMLEYKDFEVKDSLISGALSFQMTGNDGNRYIFNTYEETYTRSDGNNVRQYESAWLLDKMISYDGIDTIYFFYKDEQIQHDLSGFQSANCLYKIDCPGPTCSECANEMGHPQNYITSCDLSQIEYAHQRTFSKKIKSIRAGNNVLLFNSSNSRSDLKAWAGTPALQLDKFLVLYVQNISEVSESGLESFIDNLDISGNDPDVQVVRVVSFDFETITSGAGTDPEDKRLYLEGFHECGDVNCTEETKDYAFSYINRAELPPRNSNNYDHWGYYNDANNPTDKLFPTLYIGFNSYHLEGANRWVNSDVADYGMLEEVTFPTGGKQKFTYESNSVPSNASDRLIASDELYVNWMNESEIFIEGDTFPNYKDSQGVSQIYNDCINDSYCLTLLRSSLCLGIDGPGNNGTCSLIETGNEVFNATITASYSNSEMVFCESHFPCAWIIVQNFQTGEIQDYSFTNDSILAPIYVTLDLDTNSTYWIYAGVKDTSVELDVSLSWAESYEISEVPVGGVRIRSISHSLQNRYGQDSIVEKREYDYDLNSTELFALPTYHKENSMLALCQDVNPVTNYGKTFINIQSHPLGMTSSHNGNMIAYGKVATNYMYDDDSVGFRTEDEYIVDINFAQSGEVPVYNLNNEGMGVPKKQTIYRYRNGQYKVEEQSLATFRTIIDHYVSNNFDVAVRTSQETGLRVIGQEANYFEKQPYDYFSTKGAVTQTKLNKFDDTDLFLQQTVTNYTYGDSAYHLQVTEQEVIFEDGTVIITKYQYPLDITTDFNGATNGALRALELMNSKNRITPVVSRTTYKTTPDAATDTVVIAAQYLEFDSISLKPSMHYILELAKPLDTYSPPVKSGNSIIIEDEFGQARKRFTYNQNNRIDTVQIIDGTITKYIWSDDGGRLLKQMVMPPLIFNDSMVTKYSYNDKGQIMAVENQRGKKTRYSYDNLMRLETISDDIYKIISHYIYNYAD